MLTRQRFEISEGFRPNLKNDTLDQKPLYPFYNSITLAVIITLEVGYE